MSNRGRHKQKYKIEIKDYPIECKNLKHFDIFKKCFTPEEANLLITNIQMYSSKNKCDLREWEHNPTNCYDSAGFIWSGSKEGFDYWQRLIVTYKNKLNKIGI